MRTRWGRRGGWRAGLCKLTAGAQVDSEWHAWLHKMTDKRPTGKGKHKWQMDYTPNVTGTQRQYVPYSTVKPKMEYWSPQ